LAKLALVLFLAHWLAENQHRVKSFFMVFLPCLGVACVLTAPVLLEPDLGASVTLFILAAGMLAVAGTRMGYLLSLLLAALPPLYFLVINVPYRLRRLKFWDPWSDPNDTGFQLIHSFFALGTGGFLGSGLGGSRQKLFYLPEPHTDFILSVLGEEFGFWGVSLVLALFMLLIWRGVKVALSARDLFGTYLALGATMVIGLQAFVNSGVVMGLLPTKGLTLPFISYGGSSVMINLACVGLLLSVARHQGRSS
jgi:cell division protein FtsW